MMALGVQSFGGFFTSPGVHRVLKLSAWGEWGVRITAVIAHITDFEKLFYLQRNNRKICRRARCKRLDTRTVVTSYKVDYY
jgi:hypothetical protein